MSSAAIVIAWIALAGALASWIAGAVFYTQSLAAMPGTAPPRWLAVLAWPFAAGRIRSTPTDHAAKVNKALVAFCACLLVAAAAWSAGTNLHRISR